MYFYISFFFFLNFLDADILLDCKNSNSHISHHIVGQLMIVSKKCGLARNLNRDLCS